MMRFCFLTLLLCTLSMTCSCQTFQYSRGWTNGKRGSVGVGYNDEPSFNYNQISKLPVTVGTADEDFIDKCSSKVLKCLLRMQQNPLLLRAVLYAMQDHVHGIDLDDFVQDNQKYNKRSLEKSHQSTNAFYENSKLTKATAEDEVDH